LLTEQILGKKKVKYFMNRVKLIKGRNKPQKIVWE